MKHKQSLLHTCLHANGQFCKIDAPFQALMNPLSCMAAPHAKNNPGIGAQCSLPIFDTLAAFPPNVITLNPWILILSPTTKGSTITMICPSKALSSSLLKQPVYILKLPSTCSATSMHFHLTPHYENHVVTMYVSLDKANLDTINVSTLDFYIWQHFDNNWTMVHMQKLVDTPEVPLAQFYKHMIGQSEPILPFEVNQDMKEGSSLTWKILIHPGTYMGTVVMILAICVSTALRNFGPNLPPWGTDAIPQSHHDMLLWMIM